MPKTYSTPTIDAQPLEFDLPHAALPTTHHRVLDRREPVTYRGERVLTTDLAAEAFDVDSGRITNNFDRNRVRFEEGKHFFMLTGAALREMKDQPSLRGLVAPQAAHLLLWTERGIARHAKMLESETAWAIFEELEDTYFRVRAGAAPTLPDFTSPPDAARAWAEQYEARLLASKELEEERQARIQAERTKAWIGDKRSATAMATAKNALQKAKKLEAELDRSRQFATVKRMQLLYHGQKFEWSKLKKTSAALGIEPIDVFDANYGKVKAYHYAVWLEVYALEIPGQDGETGEAE